MDTEKRRAYNQRFYEKNAEKIHSKITCECGHTYTYYNKSRHMKGNKHLITIQKIEELKNNL